MTTSVLAQQLREAKHVLVFTGAGASAESGIPTFRDALIGLWERFDPAQLATSEAFRADPSLCWGWYRWTSAQQLVWTEERHGSTSLQQLGAGHLNPNVREPSPIADLPAPCRGGF